MNIVVAGATGLVGRTMIKVIEEKGIDATIIPVASERSVGETIPFNDQLLQVQALTEAVFKQADYALFALSASLSAQFAPIAREYCTVIDNSSYFRQDAEVPLVLPEIMDAELFGDETLIANPNCSTIQVLAAIAGVHQTYGLDKIRYTTYQSVSGSGKDGVDDLKRGQSGEEPKFYPKQIYNNVLPHIDEFVEDGYTKEEYKMINETRKILRDETLRISATCVRVPVIASHAVEVAVTVREDATLSEVKAAIQQIPSVIYVDKGYPTPIESAGQDKVLVGRLRQDYAEDKNGFRLWTVADNIRKGAASNTVEILEALIRYRS